MDILTIFVSEEIIEMNIFLCYLYIVGICVAWFQIQIWNQGIDFTTINYKKLLCLSFLSWLIYPIYAISKLIDKLNKN